MNFVYGLYLSLFKLKNAHSKDKNIFNTSPTIFGQIKYKNCLHKIKITNNSIKFRNDFIVHMNILKYMYIDFFKSKKANVSINLNVKDLIIN